MYWRKEVTVVAKIDEVVRKESSRDLPPMQKAVLKELERRDDEVFTYQDPGLQKLLPNFNPNAIDWSLWALHGKGLIGKLKMKGHRTYFGARPAIQELESRLKSNSRKKSS
jgi:hypothetical protein